MEYLEVIGKLAKKSASVMGKLSQPEKNKGLLEVAKALVEQSAFLLEENEKDVKKAEENGMKASLVDRLRLTKERIEAMAEGLEQIVALEDPVGATSGILRS